MQIFCLISIPQSSTGDKRFKNGVPAKQFSTITCSRPNRAAPAADAQRKMNIRRMQCLRLCDNVRPRWTFEIVEFNLSARQQGRAGTRVLGGKLQIHITGRVPRHRRPQGAMLHKLSAFCLLFSSTHHPPLANRIPCAARLGPYSRTASFLTTSRHHQWKTARSVLPTRGRLKNWDWPYCR